MQTKKKAHELLIMQHLHQAFSYNIQTFHYEIFLDKYNIKRLNMAIFKVFSDVSLRHNNDHILEFETYCILKTQTKHMRQRQQKDLVTILRRHVSFYVVYASLERLLGI